MFGGLASPTVVRFAADGRVLVAEKSGLIKEFSGFGDTSADIVADLRIEVHNYWDRGLLGMALDPNFAQNERVYVLYTYDAAIGGVAPRWGSPTDPQHTDDTCPTPPGPTSDGCLVSGRLSRLTLDGTPDPPEQVLIEDWCQQYPSHSIGSLEFDSAGRLYASAGDGASFDFTDYGQFGIPINPCDDPPAGVGGPQTPPSAEGGALRSLDLRTSGDPVTLDGTVIRVQPSTGAGAAANPLAQSPDPNARRIVADGLRNPFRFTISGDDEVWLGDVGWDQWEEIDTFVAGSEVISFGWPCYEASGPQPGYDSADFDICEGLYGAPDLVTAPYFQYQHYKDLVAGESCPTGSSSISGLEFYPGGQFPDVYDDALFFADYARGCIWVMRAGANGRPDPATVTTFDAGVSGPVGIEAGPDGALYYVDFNGGLIRRVGYSSGNQYPTAVAKAVPTSGVAPLQVDFDASDSSDPDPGDTLDYAWDLDGDGQYDDSSSPTPSRTYSNPETVFVGLRVTDDSDATDTIRVRIDVDNTPPTPEIVAPTPDLQWRVGQTIDFTGTASDAQQGTLPGTALDWSLVLDHCPVTCHQHQLQSFPDTGSSSFAAPDHDYPSDLLLTLTATDAQGATGTTSVKLYPRTVLLTLASNPPGLELALNSFAGNAPFTETVIEGSANTIGAPSPQLRDRYTWTGWSNGGAATHSIVADESTTLTASFAGGADDAGADPPSFVAPPPFLGGPPEELKLEVLEVKIPRTARGLSQRGTRTKLRCSVNCRAQVWLVAKGARARRMEIAGTVGKSTADLEANTVAWIKTALRGRYIRRLADFPHASSPRISIRTTARPEIRGRWLFQSWEQGLGAAQGN